MIARALDPASASRFTSLLLAATTLACGEPDRECSVGGFYSRTGALGDTIQSGERTGEAILSSEAASHSSSFDVVLTDLPGVWVGREPVTDPVVRLTFEFEYVEPQAPGVELPALVATLDANREEWGETALASAQAGGFGVPGGALAVHLFEYCQDNANVDACCTYGSPSCGGRITVDFARDEDLFPDIRVSYALGASANVYECLEDTPRASWTLEEVE